MSRQLEHRIPLYQDHIGNRAHCACGGLLWCEGNPATPWNSKTYCDKCGQDWSWREPPLTLLQRKILQAIADLPDGRVTLYIEDSEVKEYEVTETRRVQNGRLSPA